MLRLSSLFTALLLLSTGLAEAQVNSFLRQLSQTGLAQEDINVMVSAGSELYRSGNAVVGANRAWRNPNTGAHGSVEIQSVEGNCVGLIYKFQAKSSNPAQAVNSRRCLSDGRWVTTP